MKQKPAEIDALDALDAPRATTGRVRRSPRRLRRLRRRRVGTAPPRGSAPERARAGPPVPRSGRLRGTRGRGMATPMARPARHLGRERRPGGGSGRGAVGAGRTARGSGNLEIWNPGNLRGCGARQVFSFSGFQVFTLPGPAPTRRRRRGAASCSGTDREGRETGNLRI